MVLLSSCLVVHTVRTDSDKTWRISTNITENVKIFVILRKRLIQFTVPQQDVPLVGISVRKKKGKTVVD